MGLGHNSLGRPGTETLWDSGPWDSNPLGLLGRPMPIPDSHQRGLLLLSVNPPVPERFICVGARWRQIGAFRPLRRDCARLRDRIMS